MKNKPLLFLAFVLVSAAQIYVPASMIMEREDILDTGKTFRFKTAPVDPSDPFRGKYVILSFEENVFKTSGNDEFIGADELYVILSEDVRGFATIQDLSLNLPTGDVDFVKAGISSISSCNDSSTIFIDYPFNRFYMEEYKAPEAEKSYNESLLDSSKTTYALVKIKDGEAVLEDVLIDDISIRDLVESGQNP